MHPNTQIGAFHMRRRDSGKIRPADFDFWDRSQNASAAVPVVRANLAVDFEKLPEIHIFPEVFPYCAHVTVELVRRNLIAAIGALAKIAGERMSTDTATRTYSCLPASA